MLKYVQLHFFSFKLKKMYQFFFFDCINFDIKRDNTFFFLIEAQEVFILKYIFAHEYSRHTKNYSAEKRNGYPLMKVIACM